MEAKELPFKVIAIIVGLILLIALFPIFEQQAENSSTPDLFKQYYYTVYKSSSMVLGRNELTGKVDISGSNSSTVINQAIANTPDFRTVGILGDYNLTGNISLIKSVSLDFQGNLTAWHTDFLVIGDANHMVNGAYIRFNRVTGVNHDTDHSAIRLRSCTALQIYFNKMLLFRNGIYFDPCSSAYGKGTGENSFFGGAISSMDYGISANPSGPTNAWAQGNRFFVTMWQFDNFAFYAPATGPSFSMNFMYGSMDSAAYNDPVDPNSHGGGGNICDYAGGQKFFEVWVLSATLGPGSSLFTFQGELIRQGAIKIPATNLPVGVNSIPEITVIGGYTFPISAMPRSINVTIGGSFNSSEKVELQVRGHLDDPNTAIYSPYSFYNFTDTGYYEMSTQEIYALTLCGYGIFSIDCYVSSNQTATSITMSMAVLG